MCVLLWQFLLCLPVYVHLQMVLGFVLRPCVLLSAVSYTHLTLPTKLEV